MTLDKACSQCRHYQRTRTGPHFWTVDCAMRQQAFMEAGGADDCALYEEGEMQAATAHGLPWSDDE